jgi:peptidyl-prolyl cis-trans isomerase B (cyclophilin B)
VPTNKQRREAARRHLERQLERRAEREAARKRFALIASVAGTIVIIGLVVGLVIGLGGSDKPGKKSAAGKSGTPTTSTSPSSTASGSAATAAFGDCTFTKSGTAAKKVKAPADGKVSTKGTVTVDVATNRGSLTFSLDRSKAPCTVDSFVSLVKQKYFNSTPCHRLTTSGIYVLQCGDPTGTGSGGPGYSFADELTGAEKYTRGVIAMANSGANTNGSQFFVVYKKSQLSASYTVFGTVTKGLNVVDKVAAAGSDNSNGTGDGKPKLPVEINSMTIAKKK